MVKHVVKRDGRIVIFDKRKILLYQNESLDLDHYYQEPYQDEHDEIKDMGKPFCILLMEPVI